MKEIIAFLKENPVVCVATIGLDGKPKNRPFQFMLEEGGKLWFCTGSQKEVYAQMEQNPYIEITVANEKAQWIRLNGKVHFQENKAIKEKILSENPLVKSLYKSPDNPTFKVFYLEQAQAVLADFSGNPPKTYSL